MRFMKDGSRFSSLEARLLFFGSGQKLPDYSPEYAEIHGQAIELKSVGNFLGLRFTLESEIRRLRECESQILKLEAGENYAQEAVFELNDLHVKADSIRAAIMKLTESAQKAWRLAKADVTAFERQESAKLVAGAGQRKEELMKELVPQLEALVSRLTQESSALGDLMQSFRPESVSAVLGQEPTLAPENWQAAKVAS